MAASSSGQGGGGTLTRGCRRFAPAAAACLVLAIGLLHAGGKVTIGVVFSRDVAPYRQAMKGFEETLRASGLSYKAYPFFLDRTSLGAEKMIRRIRSKHPDLILTIGSNATRLVSRRIPDIPIVFSLVLPSSGKSALHEAIGGSNNVTGASMEIPIRAQFEKILDVLPNAKRIGVLYDPEVTGEIVKKASETAEALGVRLVAIRVSSREQVIAGAESVVRDVDVLWSVADSTVFFPQGLKQILLTTLRHRVPFVGLSPSFVKAGALLAFSVDYKDVGRQSAELAVRILSGERPGQIATTVPRAVTLSLNMNTAKRLRVHIGDEIKRSAQVYY
ncbi:MAG: ABC transporter substrate-binding protein [Acidobacteriota bacterium]